MERTTNGSRIQVMKMGLGLATLGWLSGRSTAVLEWNLKEGLAFCTWCQDTQEYTLL